MMIGAAIQWHAHITTAGGFTGGLGGLMGLACIVVAAFMAARYADVQEK